jgi:hypothetical protein
MVHFGEKVKIGSLVRARHAIDIIEAGYRAARTGVTQQLKTTFETLPLDELAAL